MSEGEKTYMLFDKLSNVEKKLKNDFVRCHQSYLVNISFIKRILKTEIYTKRFKVPISPSHAKATKDKIRKYYEKKEGCIVV
jgi:DNA-binding LytR/AlgR family response regulator